MLGTAHGIYVLASAVSIIQTASLANGGDRTHRALRHRADDEPATNGNLRWARTAAANLESFGVENTAGAEANFCRGGKLLPSFYLLGGPKCATTTTASELGRYGGIRAAPFLWSKKEWHFWEKFAPGAHAESVRKEFRNELDECPDARLVLGDFSVNNLAAVPAPHDMDLSPCSCQSHSHQHGHVRGGDVPRLLSNAYGGDVSGITLMMLIRNPVSRIQSSWYHAKAENFADYWGFRDCCTESFNRSLSVIIEAANHMEDPPTFQGKLGGEGSVWTSLFGRHIEEYLKYFKAGQILIVPYKQYLNRETRVPICADLRERLNIGLNCTNHEDIHENVHEHPPLEEDVDPTVLKTLNRMLERETQRLVAVLSTAGQRGANLAGFKGDVSDAAQVESWLSANW